MTELIGNDCSVSQRRQLNVTITCSNYLPCVRTNPPILLGTDNISTAKPVNRRADHTASLQKRDRERTRESQCYRKHNLSELLVIVHRLIYAAQSCKRSTTCARYLQGKVQKSETSTQGGENDDSNVLPKDIRTERILQQPHEQAAAPEFEFALDAKVLSDDVGVSYHFAATLILTRPIRVPRYSGRRWTA